MSQKKQITIRDVIHASGGAIALSNALGIHRQTVYRWKKVPSYRLQAVARISGIAPEELRPDIFSEMPVEGHQSKRSAA